MRSTLSGENVLSYFVRSLRRDTDTIVIVHMHMMAENDHRDGECGWMRLLHRTAERACGCYREGPGLFSGTEGRCTGTLS